MPRYKLTDALPKSTPSTSGKKPAGRRHDAGPEPRDAAVHQSNTLVEAARHSHKDRLVDVGRAQQTAGRQSSGG